MKGEGLEFTSLQESGDNGLVFSEIWGFDEFPKICEEPKDVTLRPSAHFVSNRSFGFGVRRTASQQ